MTDIREQEWRRSPRTCLCRVPEYPATHELKTPIISMKASLQILENTFRQENADLEKAVPINGFVKQGRQKLGLLV